MKSIAYRNPVLSGCYPDPSVCRVGDDFYLATSTFEYFPGVPIFHSRDLVNWRQLGHALHRSSQLSLAGCESSHGIFAPTLRHHGEVFYLITTHIGGAGNFYVTATNPGGEWSEPVWLEQNALTMDPSLFFDDDGRVYCTGHGGGRHGAIYQAEIDLQSGRLLGGVREIWSGTGGIWPEGPHLYKRNGLYYLMISEGGTSYEHKVTVARSESPWGPFEANPKNPILTHATWPAHPIQATGHADLVDTPLGTWWLMFLGVRPSSPRHHHLGRETFLAPVRWNADGWPEVNENRPIEEHMPVDGLPAPHPWEPVALRDQFEPGTLAPHWVFLRTLAEERWSLVERPGYLRLWGSRATLDECVSPAFVGQRQRHFRATFRTQLHFQPQREGQEAGLTLRGNEKNHYDLTILSTTQGVRAQLRERLEGANHLISSLPAGSGPWELRIEAYRDRYEFFCTSHDGEERRLGECPTILLSTEKIGGFTGVTVALFAQDRSPTPAELDERANPTIATMPPADFEWFEYVPGDD